MRFPVPTGFTAVYSGLCVAAALGPGSWKRAGSWAKAEHVKLNAHLCVSKGQFLALRNFDNAPLTVRLEELGEGDNWPHQEILVGEDSAPGRAWESLERMRTTPGRIGFAATLSSVARFTVGESSLCTVGKWSTKMALIAQGVQADGAVESVTVSLSKTGSSFSPDWELQVYDLVGAVSDTQTEFKLRKAVPFQVNEGVKEAQTVALSAPVVVTRGQCLAVYCASQYIQLKCTSGESVKYDCFYGDKPTAIDGKTILKKWSGRMGFSATVLAGGVCG